MSPFYSVKVGNIVFIKYENICKKVDRYEIVCKIYGKVIVTVENRIKSDQIGNETKNRFVFVSNKLHIISWFWVHQKNLKKRYSKENSKTIEDVLGFKTKLIKKRK